MHFSNLLLLAGDDIGGAQADRDSVGDALVARDKRTIDGAHREIDAIFRAGLLHQTGYVSLHCALLNAELSGYFAIGACEKDELKHLLLPGGEREG